MATIEESENDQKKRNKPKGKVKNVLNCKIACVAKRSRFKPRIKRVRMRSTNVFPLELPEYEKQSYTKKIVCPKCMSNIELTVRSEKAGSLYYKLILIAFFLIFIIVNVIIYQNADLSLTLNTILEINGIILGTMIVLLFLVLLNNYIKTRSKRSLRLKMKAKSSMAHELYKSKRTKYIKKKPKFLEQAMQ